jgi:hypothetical protein
MFPNTLPNIWLLPFVIGKGQRDLLVSIIKPKIYLKLQVTQEVGRWESGDTGQANTRERAASSVVKTPELIG